MNAFFGRELYIRLTPGDAAFICTTRYGKFYKKIKKFLLREAAAETSSGDASLLARRKRLARPLSLLQPDADGFEQD